MNLAWILLILLIVIYSICLPNLFERAGRTKWHGYIPFFNLYGFVKIIGRPWYWVLILLAPGVNLLLLVIMNVELGIVFNKRDTASQWMFGALPWVAIPKLAFKETNSEYVGARDWSKKKKSRGREWGEAILFAVIAASIIRTFWFEAFTIPTPSMEGSMLVGDYLFVSKLSYGPKVPQTPLSIPFIHNALPGSLKNSYVEWFQLPYFRLPGFRSVDRYDPVVFNFPHGDTVIATPRYVGHDYYSLLRSQAINYAQGYDNYSKDPEKYNALAKQSFDKQYGIKARPVDKAENYIKRCIGLPGETLQVVDRQVMINGQAITNPEHMQFNYVVTLKSRSSEKKFLSTLGLTAMDTQGVGTNNPTDNIILLSLDAEELERAKKYPDLESVVLESEHELTKDNYQPMPYRMFPNSNEAPFAGWTVDNYGPMYIPAAGESIELNEANYITYQRTIRVYEENDFYESNGQYYLNGEVVTSYTFKYNYYWMMGDNRHKSADSRSWGFVPETHVVGKAMFTWFSKMNEPQHGAGNDGIRFDRMFKLVD